MAFSFAAIVICWGCSNTNRSQTGNPEVESEKCSRDNKLDARVDDCVNVDLDDDGDYDFLKIVDGYLVYFETVSTSEVVERGQSDGPLKVSIPVSDTSTVWLMDVGRDLDLDVIVWNGIATTIYVNVPVENNGGRAVVADADTRKYDFNYPGPTANFLKQFLQGERGDKLLMGHDERDRNYNHLGRHEEICRIK